MNKEHLHFMNEYFRGVSSYEDVRANAPTSKINLFILRRLQSSAPICSNNINSEQKYTNHFFSHQFLHRDASFYEDVRANAPTSKINLFILRRLQSSAPICSNNINSDQKYTNHLFIHLFLHRDASPMIFVANRANLNIGALALTSKHNRISNDVRANAPTSKINLFILRRLQSSAPICSNNINSEQKYTNHFFNHLFFTRDVSSYEDVRANAPTSKINLFILRRLQSSAPICSNNINSEQTYTNHLFNHLFFTRDVSSYEDVRANAPISKINFFILRRLQSSAPICSNNINSEQKYTNHLFIHLFLHRDASPMIFVANRANLNIGALALTSS